MGWLARLAARRAPITPPDPGVQRDAAAAAPPVLQPDQPVSPQALQPGQPVSPEALDAALARLQSEIPDPDLRRADDRCR